MEAYGISFSYNLTFAPPSLEIILSAPSTLCKYFNLSASAIFIYIFNPSKYSFISDPFRLRGEIPKAIILIISRTIRLTTGRKYKSEPKFSISPPMAIEPIIKPIMHSAKEIAFNFSNFLFDL